ncbi:hypothetical protein DFH09DRAFT_1152267 [Mycena vulgaris]|nr:hypothetical protein DFH09DRAFT_1152267 [Mycena vulgaris]
MRGRATCLALFWNTVLATLSVSVYVISLFEFHVDCATAGWLAVLTTQGSPETIQALLNRQCNLPGRRAPAVPRLLCTIAPRPPPSP